MPPAAGVSPAAAVPKAPPPDLGNELPPVFKNEVPDPPAASGAPDAADALVGNEVPPAVTNVIPTPPAACVVPDATELRGPLAALPLVKGAPKPRATDEPLPPAPPGKVAVMGTPGQEAPPPPPALPLPLAEGAP
mmetsp:Transcript_42124/g.126084  ORF Transcript_42124/g.126084 Transcript_42124/m.126084 type:complete len:135 (+) Transcript_42124:169-573(+)